jgi:hypothetical protein
MEVDLLVALRFFWEQGGDVPELWATSRYRCVALGLRFRADQPREERGQPAHALAAQEA